MGMSTSVVGFRPPDEQWKKMKEVYDVCMKNGVDPPAEVEDFFDGGPAPDDNGMEVDLEKCGAVKKWSDDGSSGYEVDLSKLPKDVKVLRFYNSW